MEMYVNMHSYGDVCEYAFMWVFYKFCWPRGGMYGLFFSGFIYCYDGIDVKSIAHSAFQLPENQTKIRKKGVCSMQWFQRSTRNEEQVALKGTICM